MEYLFLGYSKCSTCRNAKKWLEAHGISYVDRPIVQAPPTTEELYEWLRRSQKELKSFFNTTGLVYKELGLKDRLAELSEEEQIRLLASNGMLIKRPLLIGTDRVWIGFKEKDWEQGVK